MILVTTNTDHDNDDNVSHTVVATSAVETDEQPTKSPLALSGKKRHLPAPTEDSDSDSCSSASSSSSYCSSVEGDDDGEDSIGEARQPQNQSQQHPPEWKKRKTVHPSSSCSCREEHDLHVASVASHNDDTDGVVTNDNTDEDSSTTTKAVRFVPSDQNDIYETLARSSYTPQEFGDSFLSQQEQQQTYREIAMHIRQYRADKEKQQQQQRGSHNSDEVSMSAAATSNNNNSKKTFQQLHTRKPDMVVNAVVAVAAAGTESENEERYGCLESIIEQRDSDRSERMRLACSIILKAQSQSSSSSSAFEKKNKGKSPPTRAIHDDEWLDEHYRPITTLAAKLARSRGIREEKAAKLAAGDFDPSVENSSFDKDETSGRSATAATARPASRTTSATTPTRDQQRSPLKVIACC